jgi:hypothetical protein
MKSSSVDLALYLISMSAKVRIFKIGQWPLVIKRDQFFSRGIIKDHPYFLLDFDFETSVCLGFFVYQTSRVSLF